MATELQPATGSKSAPPSPKDQRIDPAEVASTEPPEVIRVSNHLLCKWSGWMERNTNRIVSHGVTNDHQTVLRIASNANIISESPGITDPELEEAMVKSLWIPEKDLQEVDRNAVYQYWESLKGGRDYQLGFTHRRHRNLAAGRNMDDGIKWEILSIVGRRVDGTAKKLKVHWQGYRLDEASWVREADLRKEAPAMVAWYYNQNPLPSRRHKIRRVYGKRTAKASLDRSETK